MRTTSVTFVNRKGSESTVIGLTFNDIPDLIQKIDDEIRNIGYNKVDVSVDSYDFTNEEMEELNNNDIF